MSATIDERIVEMRFDNKQFESGAKETMSTLDRLKQALNLSTSKDSLKALDEVAKGVNFDSISNSVKKLEDRFSTMGIVGMRIIENLTDSMMGMVNRGINYVTNSIIQGGIKRAMNIENAHFQLQALLKDEDRVQAVMQNANDSVSGTAYAYDEAAKAASQFAASGIKEGEEMERALRGIVGVAAMTNSEYEGIARIFTTVAGNGRVMGDQLLQLSSRGLNAAATLADFFNRVNSGAAEATPEVKKTIKAITKGTKVAEADIREMVSKGKISFDVFAEAMNEAFGESAFRANETFTGALSNVKAALARIGAGFVSPLVAQNNEVVGLFNAIREKVNDVKKTLVFDEELGNVHALSKQVTDSLLTMAGSAAEFIKNSDISKPMELFYYAVEIVKNSAKGFWSVIEPLGSAIREVFAIDIDDVIKAADKLEDLTYSMRLSEEASNNLKDAAKGVASIFKLLFDSGIKLIQMFIPIKNPLKEAGGGFLSLAGASGRALSSFSEWVRSSETIKGAYKGISKTVSEAMEWVRGYVEEFIKMSGPEVKEAYENLKKFVSTFRTFEFPEEVAWLGDLRDALVDLFDSAKDLNFEKVLEALTAFKDRIKALFSSKSDTKNVVTLGDKFQEFGEKIGNALKFDNIINGVKNFRETMDDFGNWIKNTLGPIMENIPFANIISAGSSLGMMTSLMKVSKSFNKLAGSLTAIPDVLGAVKTTLAAYQNDLKANMILKIAGAILLLSAALAVLSFIDTKKLVAASITLFVVAQTIMSVVNKFFELKTKGKKAAGAITNFSGLLNNALKAFSGALKTKAIGSALKDFGIMVALIVASIAALTYMFKNDQDAVQQAIFVLGTILTAITVMMTLVAIYGKSANQGATALVKTAATIFIIVTSIKSVVKVMKDIFDMDLPSDYGVKLGIIGGIFVALAAMVLVIAKASKMQGASNFKTSSLLGVTLSLVIITKAMSKLFEMNLPDDYGKKLGIMAGIFIGLGGIIVAMGQATKNTKGAIKAGGTLLALSVFLVAIVGALVVLSILPADKVLKASLGLGAILIALGVALTGAAKVSDKEAMLTVLSMTGMIFAIIIALSALSIIDSKSLLAAASGLGIVLVSLGASLMMASKMNKKVSVLGIIAMIAAIAEVAYALSKLAEYPWKSLAASGSAISQVLVAMGTSFRIISSSNDIKASKVGKYLLSTLALIPIATALYFLANRDWKGMLSGGVAMAAVLLALGQCFKIVSSSKNIKTSTIGKYLLSCVALAEVAAALYFLADKSWDNMLASSGSLSLVLLALGECFKIISESDNVEVSTIGKYLLSCVALAGVFAALYFLADKDPVGMLAAAASLSLVLLALGACFKLIGDSGDVDKTKMLTYAELCISLLPIYLAISKLAVYDPVAMLAAATALSEVVVALGLGFALIGATKVNLESGAAFLLGAVGLIAIAQAILPLLEYDMKSLMTACTAIGTVLLEMSVALAIMAAVGKLAGAGAAIEGMEALLIFIAGFSAVLLALGALLDNETAKSLLSGGADVLALIGEAIGKFIGSIVGGVLEGISDSLPAIADNLSAFMENMQPFFDKVNAIPDGTLSNATALVGVIGLFIAAEFVSGIANLLSSISFGGGLVGLAESLSDFATGLEPFLSAISGYETSTFTAANLVAEMLLMFTEAQLISGITSWLSGSKSLSDFGEELKEFGPSIADFAESVKDVKEEDVKGAAAAASILSEVNKNLYGTEGLKQLLFGEKSLKEFAEQLEAFAPALNSFIAQTKDITEEDVKGPAAAAQLLTDVANKLPAQNGLIQRVFGEKSLKEFAEQLEAFAPSLVSFVDQTKDIKEGSVEGAKDAASLMATLASELPAQDGWVNKIFGTKSLSDFAGQLDEFGPAISDFAADVEGINADTVENAASAAKVLLTLSQELPDTGAFGGFLDWLMGKNDLGKFGDKIGEFGGGMGTFYDSVSGINTSHLDTVMGEIRTLIDIAKDAEGINVSGLTSLSSSLTKMAENGIDGFVKAFGDGEEALSGALIGAFKNALLELQIYLKLDKTRTFVNTMMSEFLAYFLTALDTYDEEIYGRGQKSALKWGEGYESKYTALSVAVDNILKKILAAIQKRYPEFKTKGETCMIRFISGVKGKTNAAVTAISDLLKKVFEEFEKKLDKWKKAGEQGAQGFIDGIKAKYQAAASAGEGLAQITVAAVESALAIESPSKIMRELGSYTGEGFVNGVTEWFDKATKTGDKLGNSTTDALKIALNEVAAMFDEEEIYDPIIRPLVNMDNVTRSVDDIAAMFNQALEISRANVGDISVSMANKKLAEIEAANAAEKKQSQTPNTTFVQNNYSPKALNRIDIYRNTRNQLAQFREATT